MKKQLMLALVAGASLFAQPAQQEFNRAIERLEAKRVTGAPYSAKAVTTCTQTLADGTKITRTIEALLARDSEGRTRREQSIGAVGPWPTNGKEHIVYINDPVAQMRYWLQPDEQQAVKMPIVGREQRQQEELAARRAVESRRKEEQEAAAKTGRRGGFVVTTSEGTAYLVGEAESKAQIEDLGDQVIEGVKAKGRREKQTIPAGDVGNDRPIEVVSEVWYSDELQAIVLSKHSDPRAGVTEYRLTNVLRAEPSRTLFEVPAGYTIKEEGRREPRRE